MSYVLVTGATGTLGAALVPLLRAANLRVRILSREAAPAGCEPGTWVRGYLVSGENLDDAVRNVNTVIHLATRPRGHDGALTRNLVEATRRGPRVTAPLPHLIYQSIVGVDQIPLGYYRQKLAAEQVVADSGLSFTIVRATQFHDLVYSLFAPSVACPWWRLPTSVCSPSMCVTLPRSCSGWREMDRSVESPTSAGPTWRSPPTLPEPRWPAFGGRAHTRPWERAARSYRCDYPAGPSRHMRRAII